MNISRTQYLRRTSCRAHALTHCCTSASPSQPSQSGRHFRASEKVDDVIYRGTEGCILLMILLLLPLATAAALGRYYPHYLHSCSTPTPTRLHIFWGRAEGPNVRLLQRSAMPDWEADLVEVEDCPPQTFEQLQLRRAKLQKQRFLMPTRQIVISFVVESNQTSAPYLVVWTGPGNYRVSYNGTQYEVVLLRQGKEVEYSAMAKTSFEIGVHQHFDSWRWGHRLFTLLRRKDKYYSFSSDPRQALTNITSFSVQFTFVEQEQPLAKIFLRKTKQAVPRGRQPFLSQPLAGKDNCAKAALNQLRKGVSYSNGKIQLQSGESTQVRQILSMTPSRTRFPWSFLWDDGFHLEVLVREDRELSLRILKSWLDSMSDEGWIPREQSRGNEREFLCNCDRFIKKDKRDGNPPALILSLQYLIDADPDLLRTEFGKKYFGKLVRWFEWYLRTQRTDRSLFLFKWFDSLSINKPGGGSLNSGLDDFPRSPSPDATQLYHVDAQCWMFAFSNVMAKYAKLFQPSKADYYSEIAKKIKSEASRVMLDGRDGLYKDVLMRNGNSQFSPFLGYINLLPLAFGLLEPEDLSVGEIKRLITQTSKMNSSYGLSSITKDSGYYYEDGDSYWRGPIWININYLVLRGINKYYPGLRTVRTQLAKEVSATVCGNWERTGFFYQNYDARSGQGSFSYPFSGWTAAVNLIINQLSS